MIKSPMTYCVYILVLFKKALRRDFKKKALRRARSGLIGVHQWHAACCPAAKRSSVGWRKRSCRICDFIWLLVWNHGMDYDFPFSWEFHRPNWRTHIFQRGRSTTNQLWFYIVPCFSREQLADLISDTWPLSDYEYPGRQKGVLRQYNPATHRIHVWYIC